VDPPGAAGFLTWQSNLIAKLRWGTFSYFPKWSDPAMKGQSERVQTEEGIEFRLRRGEAGAGAKGVLLAVLNEDEAGKTPEWIAGVAASDQAVMLCEPRGVGEMHWTRKNPPNYVERSHVLLGRTVDSGRVWDVIAAARGLAFEKNVPVYVAGSRGAGVIAAYAAALDERIAGVTLVAPQASHMEEGAPQFLNVMRVCDVPDVLGLVAPRPMRITGADASKFTRTEAAYAAAGAKDRLSFK
jgi:hypothetical protein